MRARPGKRSARGSRTEAGEAAGWYERRVRGLGDEFLAFLDSTLTRVRDTPLAFPIVQPRVRRARLPRFPYQVFFTVGSNSIEVLAVLHERRRPRHFEKR
jgi:plasmid stabilization system protein ParE